MVSKNSSYSSILTFSQKWAVSNKNVYNYINLTWFCLIIYLIKYICIYYVEFIL